MIASAVPSIATRSSSPPLARKFVAEDAVAEAFQVPRRGRLGRAAEFEVRRRAHVAGGGDGGGQGTACPFTTCAQSSSRRTRPCASTREPARHAGQRAEAAAAHAPQFADQPESVVTECVAAGRAGRRARASTRPPSRAPPPTRPYGSSTHGMSGNITPSRSTLPGPAGS